MLLSPKCSRITRDCTATQMAKRKSYLQATWPRSVWLNVANTGCLAFCVRSCAQAATRHNFHILACGINITELTARFPGKAGV